MGVRGSPSIGSRAFDIANYVFMLALAITFIYPFWMMIIRSFSPIEDVYRLGIQLWPRRYSWESWEFILGHRSVGGQDQNIALAYFNTVTRVVLGGAITLLVTFTGGYALSKRDLPYRRSITTVYILTLFFNGGLIPLFLLIRSLGMMNTRLALVLPLAINVFWIVLARNYLMTIDQAMEDSALIDGASYWQVLFRIIVPLAKPIIAVIALFSSVQLWNEWFQAMIFAPHPRQRVLQLMVQEMLYELRTEWLEEYLQQQLELGIIKHIFTPESVQAATIIITIGPIIFLYPFIQRYFVKGVMLGSLKG